MDPSPVIELNRGGRRRDACRAGVRLELVERILARGDLKDYRFAHAPARSCADDWAS
jgi:predicted RNA polymerase sigma factor